MRLKKIGRRMKKQRKAKSPVTNLKTLRHIKQMSTQLFIFANFDRSCYKTN